MREPVPAGPGGPSAGERGERVRRWVDGCPYRGLLPFDETCAEVFYGRERLAAELAVQVARVACVVVDRGVGCG